MLTIAPEVVVAFAYAEVSALVLVITMHRSLAFPHKFILYVRICVCMHTHKKDEQLIRVFHVKERMKHHVVEIVLYIPLALQDKGGQHD